jgi:23S rRNA pseudouridine1911/1915/1917 synthase
MEFAVNSTDARASPAAESDSFDEFDDDSAQEAALALTIGPEHAGARLDRTLADLLPRYSRSRLKQWIDQGHVMLDGRAARARTIVLGGEQVALHPQAAAEDLAFAPEPMALPIVHEDEAILVLDKPAGLVVHPAAGNWSGTLLNGLLHHCPALAAVPRAGIVHRLDKDTSGLMVVAKTLTAHTDLVRQLQARSVRREYLALVWGTPAPGGTVDAAIGRHPRDRLKMAVLATAAGKPALTRFRRLAAGALDQRPVSLLQCKLETGRTHQIRVHLQSIGFPLVGDQTYGKPHLSSSFGRQALHAFRLGLIHPASGAECGWQAVLPDDMAELLRRASIDPDRLAD